MYISVTTFFIILFFVGIALDRMQENAEQQRQDREAYPEETEVEFFNKIAAEKHNKTEKKVLPKREKEKKPNHLRDVALALWPLWLLAGIMVIAFIDSLL